MKPRTEDGLMSSGARRPDLLHTPRRVLRAPESAARTLRRHMSPDDLAALARLLT